MSCRKSRGSWSEWLGFERRWRSTEKGKNRSRHIFRESQTGITLDGDVVVVVDPTKIRKSQVTRERRGLAADALHHAPVACQGVNVVIEHRKVRPVVSLSEPLTRQRDAHARCNPLTKGSGRCLNSGSPTILRMSGALTLELSEILQIIQRNCEVAQGFIFSIYRLHSC